MLSWGCTGAAVLGVTPVTPLPAHASVGTCVSSPTGTGGVQGSHCPCGFALRKGLQGGTKAVGMQGGGSCTPCQRRNSQCHGDCGAAGAHRGRFLNRQTGWLLPRGLRPDPGHSIHRRDPSFLQESQDQKFSHGKTKFCDFVFAHAVLKY